MPKIADQDLDSLLSLARNKSVEARNQLAEIVGDLFLGGASNLTDQERSHMVEILRNLIHDVEMQVRKSLAARLADTAEAPIELIDILANDDIEVAHPILMKSQVLRDTELIEIIKHRTMEHQLAIANREKLSENVSDALVETDNTDVIKTLLNNKTASISHTTMEFLVEQSRRTDVFQNPLINRPDLSSDLAQKMYWWVSAALRKHIVENFDIDETGLDQTLEGVVHEAVVEGTGGTRPESKSQKLARELSRSGSITPKILVQSLRQGEIALFHALFAEFTSLRDKLVKRFIFEPGGQGMAISCKALGIDKPDFASIFLLSRSARPGENIVDPDELQRALEFFDSLKLETAQKVLARWQQNENFLFARLRLEDADPDAQTNPEAVEAKNNG